MAEQTSPSSINLTSSSLLSSSSTSTNSTPSTTITGSSSPSPLCYTTRSNIIEIIHHGIICCTELTLTPTISSLTLSNHPENQEQKEFLVTSNILYQHGDIDRLFYPRSAMKYIQILPLLESGAVEFYNFTEKELAIMCSSHNSEEDHLHTVRSILNKINLTENYLKCGGHTPISEEAAFQYVRNGISTPFRDHIYNNCSGKHAGFLALCKYLNYSLEDYLLPSHPIQKLIREAVCDVFDIPNEELYAGIDGCSAPAFALSARQASYGFAKLCAVSSLADGSSQLFTPIRRQAILKMISCITHHPDMIYGNNGFCTELMRQFSGRIIGKRGAAGVYLSGIVGQSIGCAVKIDDGTMGPQYNVTMEFLHWLYQQNKLLPPFCQEGLVEEDKNNNQSALIGREKDLQTIFRNLERYRVTPSINSMGVHVGDTKCVDGLFPSTSK